MIQKSEAINECGSSLILQLSPRVSKPCRLFDVRLGGALRLEQLPVQLPRIVRADQIVRARAGAELGLGARVANLPHALVALKLCDES